MTARADYTTPISEKAQSLVDDLFALRRIGYVALSSGTDILMRPAPGLTGDTTEETNFYEELLVNPTLLKLASHRGGLDCGGLKYIAVGYGDFTQLIMLTRDGHVSIGLSRNASAREVAGKVQEVLERHGLGVAEGTKWMMEA
jgi:hypothetical protein